MTSLVGWLDAELTPGAGQTGYLVLAGGVLLGSIVPIVPTGAVVGAAAAVAMTSSALSLPLVLLISAVAALAGDLVTFAVARAGSETVVGWLTRGQTPEKLERMRATFARRGWLVVMVGRIVPAGRIPVLLAAAAMDLTWRRLVPATAVGAVFWALLYGVLGVATGGLFDSPMVAALVATVLVLVVAGVS
ncbi:DedA family protein, partial [Pseudonocardia sp. KRD291]|uniref:DedA family protein n=1 Tax=Pseudonocardia sp. KRD291 TaxID=2792007 RepID=UPI001C4A0CB2